MAEILSITGAEVKIGEDDGKVVTVPIASLQFANPKVGDKVDVFRDGDNFIVRKSADSCDTAPAEGERVVNKHVFVWVGCFLFGYLGVDRFMRGQVGLGVLKLVANTVGWVTIIGGFAGSIWTLVDWIIALTKAYGGAAYYGASENITFDENGNYTK